jgi:hypothetical protein
MENFKCSILTMKCLALSTCAEKLNSLDAKELRNVCKNLETALIEPNMKESYVIHEELYSEIDIFLRMEAEKSMTAFKILQYITVSSLIEMFPKFVYCIANLIHFTGFHSRRRMIIIQVEAYINLFTLNSQDRFSGLAFISIENELSRSLDYSDLIDEFASVKARKVKF